MDYQTLYIRTVTELRQLAKEAGVKLPSRATKAIILDALLEADRAAKESAAAPSVSGPARAAGAPEGGEGEKNAPKEPGETAPAVRRRGRPRKTEQTAGAPREAAAADVQPAPPRTEPAAAPKPRTGAAEQNRAPAGGRRESRNQGRNARPKPSPESGVRHAAGSRENGAPEGKDRRERPEPVRGDAARPTETPRAHAARPDGRAAQQPQRRARPEEQPPRTQAEQPAERRASAAGETVRPHEPQQAAVTAREPEPAEPSRVRRDYTEVTPDGVPVGDFADGAGLLEIQQDGYGFLRAENCLPGKNDVYVSIAQIRRFNLRNGDYVVGKTRPQRDGDRYSAMVYISSVNGESPEKAIRRPTFESLIPLYPMERLRMESPAHTELSLRLIDILAPIGKGQRGMIVSQPKAGKTTLIKQIANAISDNNPEVRLIVLLIDERPEEVTDMKRSIRGDVIYSTFDEAPENHARVSEMVLEHARRMVEMGQDVVILLDSITRLARAYNLIIPPTGRSLSGGLDPGALYRPKKFFGAARNIENGGSLTIIATALVDTGSRMDDIIFEEFKGTGNMELHLDRRLSDKRIFPAIDLVRSGTRREELLLTPQELEGAYSARRMLSGGNSQQNSELLLSLIEKTANNADFLSRIKGWLSVYEKEGYSTGR